MTTILKLIALGLLYYLGILLLGVFLSGGFGITSELTHSILNDKLEWSSFDFVWHNPMLFIKQYASLIWVSIVFILGASWIYSDLNKIIKQIA